MPSAHCERASEGLQLFANDPLRFEPETQYGYSTFGWILVSAAVEAAADEPFSTFMRTQIFTPLGMTDTTFDSAIAPVADRATFYYERFNGDPRFRAGAGDQGRLLLFRGRRRDPVHAVRPGALREPVSTIRQASPAKASGQGGTLLQPATVTKLQKPQVLTSGEETAYGLGWMLETVQLGGRTHAAGGPCEPNLAGRVHVVPDLSRARDRRGGDDEHCRQGYEVDCVGNRAGFCGAEGALISACGLSRTAVPPGAREVVGDGT